MKKRVLAFALSFALITVAGCGDAKKTTNENKETTAVTVEATDASVETEETAVTEASDEEASETIETKEVFESLEDGIYLANFDTDSSMFHVNEVCEGKGTLTVEDGQMTIHIVMPSQNIVNLYQGVVEDATKEGAELIEPTVEEVTYPDGLTEEVFAFDVPVPVLDEEFDLALIGTKGTWYDHKVIVSNPEFIEP